MNIIDIIFIAILGISLISGMQKGFLASLLATFGFVGAWLIARAACMTLSQQFMTSQFRTWLEFNIPFDSFMAGLESVSDKLVGSLSENMESIGAVLTQNGVPASVVDAFKLNSASFANMPLSEYFTHTVWQAAFNVVSFAIVFAIAYAVIMLIVNLLNNVFRTPKLRGVDAILGGALGLVRGYAVICLICAILPMLFTALDSSLIATLLEDSSIGKFFLTGDSVFKDLFKVGDQLTKIVGMLPN